MENAETAIVDGGCITPEIREIMERKLQRFRRLKAWVQVGVIMEKGVIKRIRTIQDENISDLLVESIAK